MYPQTNPLTNVCSSIEDITDIVELYFCAESDELGQMKAADSVTEAVSGYNGWMVGELTIKNVDWTMLNHA